MYRGNWTSPLLPAWITADRTSGAAGVTKVMLTIAANTDTVARAANLSLGSTGATVTPVTIAISQPQALLMVTSFTEHARGGATITITGSGFSGILEENMVKING